LEPGEFELSQSDGGEENFSPSTGKVKRGPSKHYFSTFRELNENALDQVNKAIKEKRPRGQESIRAALNDPVQGDRICRIDFEGNWYNSFSLPLFDESHKLIRFKVSHEQYVEMVRLRLYVSWTTDRKDESSKSSDKSGLVIG